jgi:hypothetical protein
MWHNIKNIYIKEYKMLSTFWILYANELHTEVCILGWIHILLISCLLFTSMIFKNSVEIRNKININQKILLSYSKYGIDRMGLVVSIRIIIE